MPPVAIVSLFLFGLAIGSFVNVLALRYDGNWHARGRSRCPHCGKTLRWFELVPVVSFAFQRGRCRSCEAQIGIHYPLVELLSGAIFVFVPLRLGAYPWLLNTGWYVFSALWIAALELILLGAYIDLRLQAVPDEFPVLLGVAAVFETIFAAAYLGPDRQSFLGGYAELFGTYNNVWLSHALGAVFGAGFFWLLVLATRGKGMGMGDVILGAPLGFLFGWPDAAVLYGAAFVIGAAVGLALIALRRKTRKSAVPFVPFLAAGAAFVFFFGQGAAEWYFRIIGL